MSEKTTIWEKIQGKRSKKDLMIKGAIAIAAIVLIFVAITIIQWILMINSHKQYVEDFTNSVNHAHKNGGVTVEHAGEKHALEKGDLSVIYSQLITTGMGKPQKSAPEAADVHTLSFPDGSVMLISETIIPEKTRERDVGLYISFTNSSGKNFQYDTDRIEPSIILDRLK